MCPCLLSAFLFLVVLSCSMDTSVAGIGSSSGELLQYSIRASEGSVHMCSSQRTGKQYARIRGLPSRRRKAEARLCVACPGAFCLHVIVVRSELCVVHRSCFLQVHHAGNMTAMPRFVGSEGTTSHCNISVWQYRDSRERMAQVNSAMPSRSCKVLSGFPQQIPQRRDLLEM